MPEPLKGKAKLDAGIGTYSSVMEYDGSPVEYDQEIVFSKKDVRSAVKFLKEQLGKRLFKHNSSEYCHDAVCLGGVNKIIDEAFPDLEEK